VRVTGLLRILSPGSRHPRAELLSQYLDGELPPTERAGLQAHLRGCRGCLQKLDALASTVKALDSLHTDAPAGLADSIIATLRSEHPSAIGMPRHASASRDGAQSLRILPGAGKAQGSIGPASRVRGSRAMLRDCLRIPRLRVTLPLAVLVGIALSLINQGAAVLGGHITMGMCATCAADMLVCFLALNVALLLVMRLPVRRRQL
jgi:anti-sigma factor RsiW